MRYQGSEAVRLDAVERRRSQETPSRSFEVVEGSGLDARVREGVSPQFLAKAKVAIMVVCLVVTLGMCRVALTSATVSALESNSSIRTDIKTAQVLEDDLKVERSVLSSNSRITRIATQNYGMVYAGVGESMTIADDEVDASSDSSEQDSSSTTQADGDVTQVSDEGTAVNTKA